MFGFFLQTGQTFKLPQKTVPLKEFPQMCSSGSKLRPDIIPPISQVIPKLVKITTDISNIPLFVPMKMKKTHLEPITDLQNEKFVLLFYPQPQNPPNDQLIVVEYWKSIQPMVICLDVGGYYLGCTNDPHVIFFEQLSDLPSSTEAATPFICKAIAGQKEPCSYGSPKFSTEHIHLRRHRSP